MSDQVIVTLYFGQTEQDYALPSKTRLGELYPRLLNVLKQSEPDGFLQINSICLQRKDGLLLDPDATLLDYGVKNGTRLIVSKEG